MRFVILIALVLYFITVFNLRVDSIYTDDGLELLFRQRSHSDWVDVWHQEAHSRCRDKLLRHIYWACEKDIYRLSRRSGAKTKRTAKIQINEEPDMLNGTRWLGKSVANTFLRSRKKRSPGPSITRECCTKTGCTWEEYAEYCPSNKRRNHFW